MPPHATLVARLKVQLKLSISRLRIVQQKDQAVAKQQRRAMAQLLEQGKVESARIRVENIIRSDLLSELHEILELYCELLLARIGLLENPPSTTHASPSPTTSPLDPGLEEAVRSIIFAAPRTEIKELNQARQLLVDKFGKEFALQAMDNKGEVQIPEKVSRKLRVEPPSQELVESYLKEIAAAYDIPYGDEKAEEEAGVDEQDDNGDDDDDNDDNEPSSGGKAAAITPAKQKKKPTLSEPLSTQELSSMTPPRTLDPGLTSPIRIAPPSPSTDNANPKLRLPGTNGTVAAAAAGSSKVRPTSKVTPRSTVTASISAKKPEGAIPDVDDLESRFKMLKK